MLYSGLLHPEPLPRGSPLLTVPPQETLKHSLCGVYGSRCTQGLFESSERLWWVWGLILNVILPLLPSCSSVSKESACSAGDLGLIPGLGRSPAEGNGDPLQYSCLENLMDRGAGWAAVLGVAKTQVIMMM